MKKGTLVRKTEFDAALSQLLQHKPVPSAGIKTDPKKKPAKLIQH